MDIKQTRFIATNFYNLQGLRAIPLGLCLLLTTVWVNGTKGTGRSFLVPVLLLAGTIILFIVIDRYYLHTFGRVQRTPESRRLEWLFSVVGGTLGLGAFWLDVSYKLQVSLIGLVFAAGLLADYIRITWLVKGRYLLHIPLGAVLIAGISVLPLLGASDWWKAFGLTHQLFGITIIMSVFTVIAGIWGHIFLVRTLPPRMETNNDQAI